MYKHVWTPFLGEELTLHQEHGNSHDHYAIVIKKSSTVVGRVPREHSRICWDFLSGGGQIVCEVTGRRKKGKGLEVPCTYKFEGNKKIINRLKEQLAEACRAASTNSCPY